MRIISSGGRLPVPDGRERLLLAAGLAVFFMVGYFSIGLAADPARAHVLTSPLDRRVPFVSHAVWVYLCIFPLALSPLSLVRDRTILRRTALAYAAAMTVSFACFVAFPVTSLDLRVPLDDLDPSRASHHAVALLYALDPPSNLFPSLHLSIVVLAASSLWRAGRLPLPFALAGISIIGASVCLVKQHYVVDAAGGLALGALAGAIILLPRPAPERRSGPHGP